MKALMKWRKKFPHSDILHAVGFRTVPLSMPRKRGVLVKIGLKDVEVDFWVGDFALPCCFEGTGE